MDENFSARLARAIKLSPKSQTVIAAEAGITSAYLSDLKHGKRSNPSHEIMNALAGTLGVTLSWLLAGGELEKGNHLKEDALAYGRKASEEQILSSEAERQRALSDLEEIFEMMAGARPYPMASLIASAHQRIDDLVVFVEKNRLKIEQGKH